MHPPKPGARYSLRAGVAAKEIVPDATEAAGLDGSKVESDNKVWHNLRRNPKGRGQFFYFVVDPRFWS